MDCCAGDIESRRRKGKKERKKKPGSGSFSDLGFIGS